MSGVQNKQHKVSFATNKSSQLFIYWSFHQRENASGRIRNQMRDCWGKNRSLQVPLSSHVFTSHLRFEVLLCNQFAHKETNLIRMPISCLSLAAIFFWPSVWCQSWRRAIHVDDGKDLQLSFSGFNALTITLGRIIRHYNPCNCKWSEFSINVVDHQGLLRGAHSSVFSLFSR